MYTIASTAGITKEIIQGALEYLKQFDARYTLLDQYYDGKMTILDRYKPENLANIKVIINHAKYITDINVGYLLGNPIDYQDLDEKNFEVIKNSYKSQKISNLDHTLAKELSKFGVIYEYVYALDDSVIRSKSLDPRYCVIVYDNTLDHKPLFAVTYSGTKTNSSGTIVNAQYKDVTILTDKEIITYDEKLNVIKTKTHLFHAIPIIEYHNNDEKIGDFEPVLQLIDAYNLLQSDRMNDKQQLVEAFLILKNATLSPQQLSDLKTYRVMSVGATGDANYVTKSINEVDADVLRKAIENDIHKISMTPNMSDENFIGNSSGVAIKYKLLPFEQNTINKQNNFEVGLAKRIELYSNFFVAMNKMSVLIDLSQINIIFKRNLPSNDFEASQMINNLSGFVSKETLISQLSFVQDADDEVEKASQESSDQSALESNQFAQDKQNNSDNSNDTNN